MAKEGLNKYMWVASAAETLQTRIKKAKDSSPLAKAAVTLLAASKGQPAPLIIEAIRAGITAFGENRVQDAQDKWPTLRKDYPHIRLHLIGPLQTNKVKQALELFDVIQTIDRPKLAEAIAKELKNCGTEELWKKNKLGAPQFHNSTIPQFFIQINTGKEPQKAGVIPEEVDALIDYCRNELQLPIAGLMCVPPHDQPPAPHFAFLRSLAVSHGLAELSMGMSEDFETAVRMGSTCVRIGRALFGERNPEL
jgi:pyridoxal phosphate enzyme (YggS family)